MLYEIYLIFLLSSFAFSKYTPDWESIDSRPLPTWYDEAKFGIFMHWGIFSEVALGDWFVWYWKNASSPFQVDYMKDNYPPRFTYADFAAQFKADLFDPDYFVKLVYDSGAKYYVFTSKHCGGFPMWPSNYSWSWNSKATGPHRDIVGELAGAFRSKAPQIKFGLYYCLLEWFHPLYISDKQADFTKADYPKLVPLPQLKELITEYRPDLLWSDGAWEAPISYWKSLDFLTWLYNDSPVKDHVATNDRWGIGTACHHGGYFNCHDKYNPGTLQSHKWENAMTVDNSAWGVRRTANIEDFLTIEQLLKSFATTISCGGNMLLNVGPFPDGRVQPAFEDRLLKMGQWLALNGEAIYSSKPWIYQNDTLNHNVWYTSKLMTNAFSQSLSPRRTYNPQVTNSTVVYAILLKWPESGKLSLGAPIRTRSTTVSLLGYDGTLSHSTEGENVRSENQNGMSIDLASIKWWRLPNLWAWVFKLENLGDDSRKPRIDHLRMKIDRGQKRFQ